MLGFIKSFGPLSKIIFKKYKVEVFLLLSASILTLISIFIFIKNNQEMTQKNLLSIEESNHLSNDKQKSSPSPSHIFIDISGAVDRPGVYEVTSGARLKDALIIANGLTADAEKGFFNRNFNLSRILNDQEKIYIPSAQDINSGIVMEQQRTLDYTSPSINNVFGETVNDQAIESVISQPIKININAATIEVLDQLPGIGKATGQKIMQNRPYSKIEDLLTKKVVKKNVFDQIKDLIQL